MACSSVVRDQVADLLPIDPPPEPFTTRQQLIVDRYLRLERRERQRFQRFTRVQIGVKCPQCVAVGPLVGMTVALAGRRLARPTLTALVERLAATWPNPVLAFPRPQPKARA